MRPVAVDALPGERPRSLHWWISVAWLALGLLAAGVLVVQSFQSQRLVEHQIWREMLAQLAAIHQRQRAAGLPISTADAGPLHAWYLDGDALPPAKMPVLLATVPPGYYSTEGLRDQNELPPVDGESFHALVTEAAPGRIVTLIDITELEDQQNGQSAISALVVLLFMGAVVAFLIWLRRNLVQPVAELSRQLQAIDPRSASSRLPSDFRQREIQDIALACNAHLERVEQFIERERSLLSQASHEFRTPIAVIAGAADILRLQPLPAAARPALNRIGHTVTHLTEIMEALLDLGREDLAGAESPELAAVHRVLPELVRDHAHLLEGKAVSIQLLTLEPTYINVPYAMVRIAVGNLLRNAVENTGEGRVEIALIDGVVHVRDTGEGFDAAAAARRFRERLQSGLPGRGQGLGLFLIGRIADRYGWRLTLLSTADEGTRVTLDMRASRIPDLDEA